MLHYHNNFFFVVGNARSGTTSLMNLIQGHPDIGKCTHEPFTHWNLEDKPLDKLKFEKYAKKIFRECRGIKELSHEYGYCGLARRYFFSLPVEIIRIYRKNKLRQTVSLCLARKTKIWDSIQVKNDYSNRIKEIGPISLEEINRTMKEIYFNEKKLDREIKKSFLVYYEELFFSSIEKQESILMDIFNYINLKPLVTKNMKFIFSKGRQNNDAIYRSIPNIEEINSVFGNEKNGYIW